MLFLYCFPMHTACPRGHVYFVGEVSQMVATVYVCSSMIMDCSVDALWWKQIAIFVE